MIPNFPEFKSIEISDRALVESFTREFPPYSDFDFTTLWVWDLDERGGLSQLNNNLIIRFFDCISSSYSYSFIGSSKIDETIETIFKYFKENGIATSLRVVPEFIPSWYTKDFSKIRVEEDPANFDYVYSIDNLIAYSGKDYATARNLMNRFLQRHEKNKIVYVDITDEKNQKLILDLIERWKSNKDFQLDIEDRALSRFFQGVKNFKALTLLLYVDDKIVGFSISEGVGKGYAITHFAKGDINYAGVYSYLMWATANMLSLKRYKFLNYEEDLGIPALRHAKAAYAPVLFLKKCSIDSFD